MDGDLVKCPEGWYEVLNLDTLVDVCHRGGMSQAGRMNQEPIDRAGVSGIDACISYGSYSVMRVYKVGVVKQFNKRPTSQDARSIKKRRLLSIVVWRGQGVFELWILNPILTACQH